jgi:hypothetical protein
MERQRARNIPNPLTHFEDSSGHEVVSEVADVSCTSNSGSSEILVPHLGTLSGRAIFAVGTAEIVAAGEVWRLVRSRITGTSVSNEQRADGQYWAVATEESSSFAAGDSNSQISLHSRWTTTSDGSFTPGVGMISGKGVLAIGKAELAGIRWIWAKYRRRVISARFPPEAGARTSEQMAMYDDLMYFCGYVRFILEYLLVL